MKYKVRESKTFTLRKENLEEGIINVLKYLEGQGYWEKEKKKRLDFVQLQKRLAKAYFNLRNEIYQWQDLSQKRVHAF